jgi:hypothetical protein
MVVDGSWISLGFSSQIGLRVVDTKTTHRAKSNRPFRTTRLATNPCPSSFRANLALLRLVQSVGEVTLAQSLAGGGILNAESFSAVG